MTALLDEILLKPKPRILTRDTGVITMPTREVAERIIRVAEIMRGDILSGGYRLYQRVFAMRIVEALIEHEEAEADGELTGLFSRQSGKTEVIGPLTAALSVMLPLLAEWFPDDWRFNFTSSEGMYQGYKNGLLAGIYAPVRDQARTTFERVQQCFSSESGMKIMEELGLTSERFNGNEVLLSNGSVIRCGTASMGSNIESKSYQLLILEECQDIPDVKIEQSLDPMVAAYNGLIVKIGTCDVRKANFYRSIERNIRAYALKECAKPNHFYFPYQVVERYNSSYKVVVAKAKKKYGEHSNMFRLKFACRWLLDEGQFTTVERLLHEKTALTYGPFSDIWTRCGKNVTTVNHSTRVVHRWKAVAGIDFAKVNDSTVVVVVLVDWDNPLEGSCYYSSASGEVEVNLCQKHIVGYLELSGVDYEQQFFMIQAYLANFQNLVKVVVDANGVGSSIADRMSATYQVEVEHFNSASTPDKSSAQLFYQQELHSGRVTFPYSDEAKEMPMTENFTSQHLDAQKNIVNNYILFRHPETEGAKDDYLDGATMAIWGCREQPSINDIQVYQNNIFYHTRRR